jgi:excisionase family DNA binding protein
MKRHTVQKWDDGNWAVLNPEGGLEATFAVKWEAEDFCYELNGGAQDQWHSAILTADKVAERLGVASSTVRNWCADGTLKGWKPTPRSAWLISEADLAEFTPPQRGRPKAE